MSIRLWQVGGENLSVALSRRVGVLLKPGAAVLLKYGKGFDKILK